MTPIVIVNFKTYQKATGEQAVKLAQLCAQRDVWVSVQATDIYACVQTGAKVLAQHVDDVDYGSNTGTTMPQAVKQAGAHGTLLNHSERRLPPDVIASTILRCKQLGLYVVLCAESIQEAKRFSDFGADMLAIELPELIGGDVSIVQAEPGIVANAVSALGENVLLGAGVSSYQDLQTALDEGARGVLLASAIAKKTDDPAGALDSLLGH